MRPRAVVEQDEEAHVRMVYRLVNTYRIARQRNSKTALPPTLELLIPYHAYSAPRLACGGVILLPRLQLVLAALCPNGLNISEEPCQDQTDQ